MKEKRYSASSRIRTIKIKTGSGFNYFDAEIIESPLKKLSDSRLEILTRDVDRLVRDNWGKFGLDFIKKHILHSEQVLLLKGRGTGLVGLASIDKRTLSGQEVYYFEMTVVDKKYESLGLSYAMNFMLMKNTIIKNFLKGIFHLDFFLITPNMKVLGSLANLSSFIYPNPYLLDYETGLIPPADSQTWAMARELIRTSDFPKRKLHKVGLVLDDSYKDTPWLIYKKGKQPKYRDEIVNRFGNIYLGYDEEAGKELIVRVKFNLKDIIRGVWK